MNFPVRIETRDLGEVPEAYDAAMAEWRRSVDRRRFMTSRFVRRGASYGNALRAAHTLFPLLPMPRLPNLPGKYPFSEGVRL